MGGWCSWGLRVELLFIFILVRSFGLHDIFLGYRGSACAIAVRCILQGEPRCHSTGVVPVGSCGLCWEVGAVLWHVDFFASASGVGWQGGGWFWVGSEGSGTVGAVPGGLGVVLAALGAWVLDTVGPKLGLDRNWGSCELGRADRARLGL